MRFFTFVAIIFLFVAGSLFPIEKAFCDEPKLIMQIEVDLEVPKEQVKPQRWNFLADLLRHDFPQEHWERQNYSTELKEFVRDNLRNPCFFRFFMYGARKATADGVVIQIFESPEKAEKFCNIDRDTCRNPRWAEGVIGILEIRFDFEKKQKIFSEAYRLEWRGRNPVYYKLPIKGPKEPLAIRR